MSHPHPPPPLRRRYVWTPLLTERALRLRAAGWTYVDIGREYGVTYNAVRYHLDDDYRAGIRRRAAARRRAARTPLAPSRLDLYLPSAHARRGLAAAARSRGVLPEALAARILQAVFVHDLLAAVLDDGKPSGTERGAA